MVYNVHNLLHLSRDVKVFNCSLNHISAFPFENYLQKLKRLVHNEGHVTSGRGNLTANDGPIITKFI